MRLLFTMDDHDHAGCTRVLVRNSARSIIRAGGKLAMVYSRKYDYYKFPGGGIESGETPVDAMLRETREEAGLLVRPETVREYGFVHRVEKHGEERFVQDNFYYLCEVRPQAVLPQLDDYESEEAFTLAWVAPEQVIEKNRRATNSPYPPAMLEREARVVECLLEEGLL